MFSTDPTISLEAHVAPTQDRRRDEIERGSPTMYYGRRRLIVTGYAFKMVEESMIEVDGAEMDTQHDAIGFVSIKYLLWFGLMMAVCG